jgi:hypothetical protein
MSFSFEVPEHPAFDGGTTRGARFPHGGGHAFAERLARGGEENPPFSSF